MKLEKPLPNDDGDFAPEEIDSAVNETSTQPGAPEIDARTKDLTEWDQPPEAAGHEAPKIIPEDETSYAQELVNEGEAEADREQRIAASDPDFEP